MAKWETLDYCNCTAKEKAPMIAERNREWEEMEKDGYYMDPAGGIPAPWETDPCAMYE